MTTTASPAKARARRRQTDVYVAQLAAIANWHAVRRAEERSARTDAASASRQQRLEHNRRMDVLRCEHEAMIQRTHEQLCESAAPLRTTAPRRAVLALHSLWFGRVVAACLAEGGVCVVAHRANGAEAVGIAVAEQPDLVLVGAVLPMVSGEQVIQEVCAFAPDAVVAARAQHDGQIGPLLEAGARIAFTRRVSPADVSRELCLML